MDPCLGNLILINLSCIIFPLLILELLPLFPVNLFKIDVDNPMNNALSA